METVEYSASCSSWCLQKASWVSLKPVNKMVIIHKPILNLVYINYHFYQIGKMHAGKGVGCLILSFVEGSQGAGWHLEESCALIAIKNKTSHHLLLLYTYKLWNLPIVSYNATFKTLKIVG
jgi:hypothetical protein